MFSRTPYIDTAAGTINHRELHTREFLKAYLLLPSDL